MAFPRKYQKVALRDGDDDVQLTTLRKRVETAADDVQLAQTDDSEADSKQSGTVEERYAIISAACKQIMRHKRLPLSSTLLNDEESISLLDYIVRQVYVEDLPDDPYATSPSAPSLLSGLPALAAAASTTFPPLTSPPHPLHLPTYNLLASTLTHLHSASTTASSSAASPAVSAIASQRVFRVLRGLVADWKYSEQKLGMKEAPAEQHGDEEEEEVEGMGDWLADAEDGDEGDVESMSMADFLGQPESEAVREAEDEDEEEEDEQRVGRSEHRIDVRRPTAPSESKESRRTVAASREAKLADEFGDEGDDELDEVRLDDLALDDEREPDGDDGI